MTGTAIAQAIPILISPVLSRLYTPDDFGILALFMSFAAIISVIITGRYELAIMLPAKEKDAGNLLALSLLFTIIGSLITLIIVLIFKSQIAFFFEEPNIEKWLFLLPVVIFFAGIFQSFNYWSIRHKSFKLNSTAKISQSVTMSTTNLAMGFAGTGSIGLISGYIFGQIASALVLGWKVLTHPKSLLGQTSIKGLTDNAKRYRNFPKINAPHAFIDSLQNNGIVYLIMYFFSKAVLGSYSFAFRVLKAPVGLVGNAIYQVFYQKATQELKTGKNIQPLVVKIYRNLFFIGLPVFSVLFFFIRPIFVFVFGEEWETSGEIAQILIPWIFLNFIANPVSSLTVIMNKQKEAMFITFADIILKITALLIGGINNDYRLGFILMSVFCSLLLLFSLFWYYKISASDYSKTY